MRMGRVEGSATIVIVGRGTIIRTGDGGYVWQRYRRRKRENPIG